jgi:hypothetical protein
MNQGTNPRNWASHWSRSEHVFVRFVIDPDDQADKNVRAPNRKQYRRWNLVRGAPFASFVIFRLGNRR